MYSIDAEEFGTVDIMRQLDALIDHETELDLIRPEIVDLIQTRNRADRLAGVDKDGIDLLPLKESTLKRRKGTGPPLAESGPSARVINNLVVDVEADPNKLDIKLMWPGCEWLQYHVRGNPPLAGVRDILGMRPATIEALDRLVVEESDRQLAERIEKAGRGGGFFGGLGRFSGGQS